LIDRRGRRRASTDGRRRPRKAALAARVYTVHIYARPVEAGKLNKQQFKGIFGMGEGNNEYTMWVRVCVCVCRCWCLRDIICVCGHKVPARVSAACADAEAVTGRRHLAGRGRAYYISRARESE